MSHAGDGHGHPAVPMDLTADPWAGRDPRTTAVDQAAMGRRYGPHWQSGVTGPHSNVYEDGLREKFSTRTATWPVQYEEWDGNPIGREVNDAFYSKDTKVTGGGGGGGRTCEQQLAEARQQLTQAQQDLARAQQDLAQARQDLTQARQDLDASRGEVAALTATVGRLREVPADITKTVQALRTAGPRLEIKTGLKAAFRRLEQWILKRETL